MEILGLGPLLDKSPGSSPALHPFSAVLQRQWAKQKGKTGRGGEGGDSSCGRRFLWGCGRRRLAGATADRAVQVWAGPSEDEGGQREGDREGLPFGLLHWGSRICADARIPDSEGVTYIDPSRDSVG